MRNVKILAAAGLLTMAGVAQADVTGTATIVSDYDWRGWTQTNYDPALQLSIDYANESGWYVGTWGSNVGSGLLDGSDPSTEVDVYTGFKGEFGQGFGWDVGLNYYAYPGASDANTVEIYGKLSYSVITGSLFYTDDYFDSGESAYYISLDAAIPAGPLSIDLHAGLSDGDAFDFNNPLVGYTDGFTDYSIGVSYTANNLTLGLKWVTQDSDDAFYAADKDDRVILSVSTSLPW